MYKNALNQKFIVHLQERVAIIRIVFTMLLKKKSMLSV